MADAAVASDYWIESVCVMDAAGMTYHYELFSQDFSDKLLATTDKAEVEKFLRDSGQDSLPIRVEWGGRSWKERWSGRIGMLTNGATLMQNESDYIGYLMAPSRIDEAGHE